MPDTGLSFPGLLSRAATPRGVLANTDIRTGNASVGLSLVRPWGHMSAVCGALIFFSTRLWGSASSCTVPKPTLIGIWRSLGSLHSFSLTLENATDAVYRSHLNRVKEILPEPGRNLRLLHKIFF